MMKKDTVDKRRFVRVEFPFTIHIYPPQGDAISTYTENASAGGVKVTIMEELKECYVVGLEIFTRLKVIKCEGKIAWIKKRESKYLDGTVFFDAGIEFQHIDKEDRIMIQTLVNEALGEDKEIKLCKEEKTKK